MLKIRVNTLKPGMKLGKDIFTYDGKLLLAKGTVIAEEHLKSFANRGISEVYIMEASPQVRTTKKFEEAFDDSLDLVKSFMLEAKLGQSLDHKEIEASVEVLQQQVFSVNDIFKHLRLMKDKDDYLFTHSVNVSLLSILIGRWLKCEEGIIKKLGMAGMLHDIGKVYISSDILNKPGKLTPEEFEEIKKHPILGYNFLMQSEDIDDDVARAVLMHHERLDGSGYPMGVRGKINFFASVVAVADVYDAVTSNRTYAGKLSPYAAADILWEESFGKLDPKIVKVFYDRVANFYVGNEVVLSNNKRGVVVYVHQTQPTRPIVMVGENEFINLAEEPDLAIVEVLD
ncbi:HD-GYP domain-containing protein [Thermosyntropha sp.]|uniref:HD-GYP domain-containing protein n=1 Tax=Thermosyntropha sp. TaxID=2740820 RepID=UPI0025EE3613|nr:HD-GYP domain-containing protein [Thermosyntropha sp.]MBO8159133.1 HD-GYP domain-containing protein [Thermosyntropha sp.]